MYQAKRTRKRKAVVEPLAYPIPRISFAELRTEQRIRDHRFFADVAEEPKTPEILTENVVRRTFSYPLEHDSAKFRVWTKVPSKTYLVKTTSDLVLAGETKVYGKVEGMGECYCFLVNFRDARLVFRIHFDERTVLSVSPSTLYTYFGSIGIPDVIQLVHYEGTESRAIMVGRCLERFRKAAIVEVYNPTTVNLYVEYITVQFDMHHIIE